MGETMKVKGLKGKKGEGLTFNLLTFLTTTTAPSGLGRFCPFYPKRVKA